MKKLLSNRLRILFATFSPYKNGRRESTNGNVEPMIAFFAPRTDTFILIDQPHTGSSLVSPIVELYKKGTLVKTYQFTPWYLRLLYAILTRMHTTDNDTSILFKLRDFVTSVLVGRGTGFVADYFIGFESVHALAGIVLKRLGRVKHAVYYVSDYSPMRYSNLLKNWLYIMLDRYCCYASDYVWDVSRAMQSARVRSGLNPTKSAPVIHVPNALDRRYIKHLPVAKRIPYSLVFMGTLGYENGPDVAIEALTHVIPKFPKTQLHIIGKGEGETQRLRNLAKKLAVETHVTFHGFIADTAAMFSLLRRFMIALAPYRAVEGSVRWYGDSLKLRAYAAAGLPIITSPVPPLGRELAGLEAAVITGDNGEEVAAAVMDFFAQPKLYSKYFTNVIRFAKHNTWDVTFANALKQMEAT